MSAFEQTIRLMALDAGHDVAPSTPVQVEMTGEWSGYSEYSITNQWDQFTVRCGTFVRVYQNEEESRHYCDDQIGKPGENYDSGRCRHYAQGPTTALAKLFDDLAQVQVVNRTP